MQVLTRVFVRCAVCVDVPQWSTQVAMAYGHVLKELADRERANSGNAKAGGPTVL